MMRGQRCAPAEDAETIARLRAAMTEETGGHHLDVRAALVTARPLRPGPRRPRRPRAAGLVAAAVVIVAAITTIAVAVARSGGDVPPATSACAGAVRDTALPGWATAGFSSSEPVERHVTGARGDIVGILFTDGLYAPPRKGQHNKILWVSRRPTNGSDLTITARRDGRGPAVTRTVVGGPGPSTIDLPSAGCWTFDLSWSGRHDTVEVPYRVG